MFRYDFKKLYWTWDQEIYKSCYGDLFDLYRHLFIVYRRKVSEQAFSHMTGLLSYERGKGIMERMEEEIGDLEYHQYQHFIMQWQNGQLVFDFQTQQNK